MYNVKQFKFIFNYICISIGVPTIEASWGLSLMSFEVGNTILRLKPL